MGDYLHNRVQVLNFTSRTFLYEIGKGACQPGDLDNELRIASGLAVDTSKSELYVGNDAVGGGGGSYEFVKVFHYTTTGATWSRNLGDGTYQCSDTSMYLPQAVYFDAVTKLLFVGYDNDNAIIRVLYRPLRLFVHTSFGSMFSTAVKLLVAVLVCGNLLLVLALACIPLALLIAHQPEISRATFPVVCHVRCKWQFTQSHAKFLLLKTTASAVSILRFFIRYLCTLFGSSYALSSTVQVLTLGGSTVRYFGLSGTVGGTASSFNYAFGLALGPGGHEVVVADNNNNRLVIFDAASGKYLGQISSVSYPAFLQFDSFGRLWATLYQAVGSVLVF